MIVVYKELEELLFIRSHIPIGIISALDGDVESEWKVVSRREVGDTTIAVLKRRWWKTFYQRFRR
jgi:hypothetical protein